MKHTLTKGLLILLGAILCYSCTKPESNYSAQFDKTIENHFNAIQSRDLEGLLKTVDSNRITLILPNGKHSTSFEAYKNVNKDWFSEETWSVEHKIIEKKINKETGFVLTEIHYSDKDEKGEAYSFKYFLSLVFELQNNEWKLIFDQNTIIK